MRRLLRVGIALGSNLGDRIGALRTGFRRLREISAGPAEFSRVYETEPVDCCEDAPWFLNAVCEIGWDGEVPELFRRTSSIEAETGRVRTGVRNAPRRIDIDLLYAGDLVMRTAEVVLPHPRMFHRRFVMQPLSEIRPLLVLPGQTRSVRELLEGLESRPEIRLYPERLDEEPPRGA
jgi:2-amino-4-hydroxy-6-hydroxymethyldihydropteridine diphosphokinase